MSKKIKVLPVGTEVIVVKDSVSHCIPKGTVSVITDWDGSDTAPVYRLNGYHTSVWFSDVKPTETTTPKTKETKTMNTKKPGTSHGKPTAKGLRAQPKAKATVKPKYPAAREALTYGVTVTGKSTKESIKGLLDLTIEIHNGTLKDLATTGTKLDRALVDLKEAKAKIKELSKALEAAK